MRAHLAELDKTCPQKGEAARENLRREVVPHSLRMLRQDGVRVWKVDLDVGRRGESDPAGAAGGAARGAAGGAS